MYQKQQHHQQAWSLLYTRTSGVFSSFFFGWGSCPFLFLCCTYVPRVCRVIPCPILLVRDSYHTVFSCDNNSVFITLDSEQKQLFRWDVSKTATSPASMITAVYSYMCRVFLGGGWDLALYKGVPGFELDTYRHAHHEQRVYTVVYMCLFFPFFFGLLCCPLL